MSESPWKRGWEDWWSAGRSWFVRALGMSAIGAAIGAAVGYFWGPRMLAHYSPWVGGLVAGGGAALVWAALTLIASFLRSPVKLIGERDRTIESKDARIRELETAREAEIAKRPNIAVEFTGETKKIVHMKISNSGGPANKLSIKVDSDLAVLRGTHHLTGSGISLLSNESHTFEVASAGATSGGRITEWRLRLDEHERTISMDQPIIISITCEPENRGGRIQWQLTLHETGPEIQPITPPLPS